MKSTTLRFEPWIGDNYETNKDGKILLLGESHYCGEEEASCGFTREVIQGRIDKEKMESPFFDRIEDMFEEIGYKNVWKQVAFSNLIQNPLDASASQPEQKDIATIKPAFERLLADLKPDKIVLFSKRLFEVLPTDNCYRNADIEINSKKAEVWHYDRNGHISYITGVNHASRMFGNSYKEWVPLIKDFIETKTFPAHV